jgi:hypothetical protein
MPGEVGVNLPGAAWGLGLGPGPGWMNAFR